MNGKYTTDVEYDFKNVEISENKVGYDDSIIKTSLKSSKSGELISKLVSSYNYVYMDENILEVANELYKHVEISALGVINFNNRVEGIIVREELFDLLGKPYGRDIYKNRNISEVMKPTKCFFYESNIFIIAEILKDELHEIDNAYYILVNKNHEFYGIFSTKRILIYLSDITQKDLDLSQRLQLSIVNEEDSLNGEHFETVSISKMAKGVGGDFYTIKKYEDNRWIIAVCDVSGKGISASLLTSLLGGMFNIYDFNNGLKNFIKILNNYIFKTFKLEKFITGILIDFNEKSGEFKLCDMGHSYLYICNDKKILKLKSKNNNYPIGITEDIEPVICKHRLLGGDTLFIYTDGIIDQTDLDDKVYSENRLELLLKKCGHKSIKEVKDDILGDIEKFKKTQTQQDDITFILLKYFEK